MGENEAGEIETARREQRTDGESEEHATDTTRPPAPHSGESRLCEWCQQSLPPPRNPRRRCRPQRYHQAGEGPRRQNCTALADAARKTASAAAAPAPWAALRAFPDHAP